MLMSQVAMLVSRAIDIYCLLIIVWCVLSFFPRIDPRHPVVEALQKLTSPVLTPIRRMLPAVGGMDFSPLIALFLLRTVQQLVVSLVVSLNMGMG